MRGPNHHFHRLRVHFVFSAVGLLAASCAFASKPDACQQIDALTASTSLDREGMQPWHMRLSFQLFDLEGNPQETGTVEEWWAAPDRTRVVITSPSFNETLPGERVIRGRGAYLVHLLLSEVVHPLHEPKQLDQYKPSVASRKFGQKSLNCTSLIMKDGRGRAPQEYCVDPDTSELRIMFYDDGVRSDALNDLSTFANTQIANSRTIAYEGQPAIRGHIESIAPFDPDHSEVALGPLTSPQNGVTPARLLNRVVPVSRRQRGSDQTGFAVLHFHILPNGKAGPIDVIFSTGPAFTDASTEAVQRWTYTPAKRDGVTIECESTLTITFHPTNRDEESYAVSMLEELVAE